MLSSAFFSAAAERCGAAAAGGGVLGELVAAGAGVVADVEGDDALGGAVDEVGVVVEVIDEVVDPVLLCGGALEPAVAQEATRKATGTPSSA